MVAKKIIFCMLFVFLIIAFIPAFIAPSYASAITSGRLKATSSIPRVLMGANHAFTGESIVPRLAPSIAHVISIWGGARESIVLKSDGTVWDWGINDCILGTGPCGKLGDGTTTERDMPVQVHGPGNVGYLTSITAIMGGEHTNYALKSDGTLWAWGGNFTGQLGDGTYTNSETPVQVSGLTSVTSLGGRGYHNLAIKSDGTVWTWGWNRNGELGHDTTGLTCPNGLFATCSNVPVQVVGISNPLAVTGGGFFSLALMSDHTLKGWGQNGNGQVGDGSFTDRPAPVSVSILTNVTQVSAGWKHAVALTSDGTVWTWGDNGNGEIGNGFTNTTDPVPSLGITTPFHVPGLTNVVSVSAGDSFTAVLKSDGTVWTWGYNTFGQLGNGGFIDNPTPAQVPGLSNVILMAARDYHMLVTKSDGTVWAWGSGKNGELGNNDNTTDRNKPIQVLGIISSMYQLSLPLLLR